MKTIELPCYGMVITLSDNGGFITSDLHVPVMEYEIKAAIDAIESLVLAHACAGVDVESLGYIEGIETAIEAAFYCWE
jgi:hypothetical protein